MTDFVDKGLHNWHTAIKLQGEGWRLPTIFELIDSGLKGYWSSSTGADFTPFAWIVNFKNGSVNADNKTRGRNLVRLVRGEPSSELELVTMEEVEQCKEAYELQCDIAYELQCDTCEKCTNKGEEQ